MTPIPLLLWCPGCGTRHIDRGEWATREHRTHECNDCGMRWAPAAIPTVGVEKLPDECSRDGLVTKARGGLPDYHTMLGEFCKAFGVPGSPTWWEALETVRSRGLGRSDSLPIVKIVQHDPDASVGCEGCPLFHGRRAIGMCVALERRLESTLDHHFPAPADCPLRSGIVAVEGVTT